MAAPTTATLTTVKIQLVSLFKTALATSGMSGGQVPVTYSWDGPNAGDGGVEAVFLGYHPELRDLALNASNDIPSIKSGRQQTREDYDVPVTVWTFRPDLYADQAQQCEVRAETLFAACASTIADDPQLGLAADQIRFARLGDWESTLWPFRGGWACSWVFDVFVSARLR